MVRQSLSAMVLAAMFAVAGCGGGGSSSATTYDLNAFETKFVQHSHSYSLSASVKGSTFTLQLNAAPASSPPAPPVAACAGIAGVVAVDSTVKENGIVISTVGYDRYYQLNPFKILCDYDPTSGQVSVYADQEALPVSATVGDSGSIDSQTTYNDTGLSSVFSTGTDTWSLVSDGTTQFCENSVTDATGGGGESSELDCFTINSSGNTSGLVITDVAGGVTYIFK